MKYFVASNLNHDKKEYVRGDVLTLDEATAAPLVEAGVLSTSEQLAAAPVGRDPQVELARAKAEAELPSTEDREESGEPSIDAPKTPAKKAKKGGKDLSADL